MDFFVGLNNLSHAWPFKRCMISASAIRGRKTAFRVNDWILDSGAFTELSTHGRWRNPPDHYAQVISQVSKSGNLLAAVAQDYMCEEFILRKTGLSVEQHQELTTERYAALVKLVDVPIIPVLQGWTPQQYAAHIDLYGALLQPGAWVGVGSVCKRNANPDAVEAVLRAVKSKRPDLRLHGFGLKITALRNPAIRSLLFSSDSMAWTFEAWRDGRDNHDPRNALVYCARVQAIIGTPCFVQENLFEWWNHD